jgi:hypothetical protein
MTRSPLPCPSRLASALCAARRFACVAAWSLAAAATLCASAEAAPLHPFFSQVQFRGHDGARGNGGARAAMREQRMQQAGAQRAQRAAQREQAQQQRPQEIREVAPQAPARPIEQSAPEGRPGRLTPEERRALRQQINDAGREIYRPRRP